MSRLVLVRHGQTAWNAEGRWQGQTDVPLDQTGQGQAAAMAGAVAARYDVSLLWSSDLTRAVQTCEHLHRLTGLVPTPEPGLREIFTGAWEGLLAADIEARWPDDYHRWIDGEDFTRAGGAETRAEVAARTAGALRAIAAATPPTATSVVVGHGASLRAGAALLVGLPMATISVLGSLRNCHWIELTDARSGSAGLAFGRAQGWVIEGWNLDGAGGRTVALGEPVDPSAP